MPSLKFQIINCPKLKEARAYNKQHMKMKEKAHANNAKSPTQRMPTNKTVSQYTDHAITYGEWCKITFGCKDFTDCDQYIQTYADHLVAQGKSPDTIHTYLAGICFVWDVPLKTIKKPIRHAANNTKSRGHKKSDRRKDTQRSCSPRLYDFASVICLRRHDYTALRQNNLVVDEAGHLCVEICKGKGGKYQLQRVPAGQEAFVRSLFNGDAGKFVFEKEEMGNKIDLHHLRHMAALREYRYYEHRIKNEDGYREQLIADIKKRWNQYNDRPPQKHEMEETYKMRGKNRELAKKLGFQYSFDRLAILATSIFHLSHWRNGVTVRNYILAALVDEAMEQNENKG